MTGYTTKSKKGDDCVLHYNGKLYYFKHAAESDDSKVVAEIPTGYEVVLNDRTGWPFLKKTE
jgi:hypothetical protein